MAGTILRTNKARGNVVRLPTAASRRVCNPHRTGRELAALGIPRILPAVEGFQTPEFEPGNVQHQQFWRHCWETAYVLNRLTPPEGEGC